MYFEKVKRKTSKRDLVKMIEGMVWTIGGVIGFVMISVKIARYILS